MMDDKAFDKRTEQFNYADNSGNRDDGCHQIDEHLCVVRVLDAYRGIKSDNAYQYYQYSNYF
jgi:hypothetical protein